MDGFWNFMSSIPWYAWIAIVAIICGTIRAVYRQPAK